MRPRFVSKKVVFPTKRLNPVAGRNLQLDEYQDFRPFPTKRLNPVAGRSYVLITGLTAYLMSFQRSDLTQSPGRNEAQSKVMEVTFPTKRLNPVAGKLCSTGVGCVLVGFPTKRLNPVAGRETFAVSCPLYCEFPTKRLNPVAGRVVSALTGLSPADLVSNEAT